MQIFKKVEDIQDYLSRMRKKSQTIGFVPTMGALHKGHLSLIKQAKEETSLVVACIFVNPTQFNDSADLDNYPRTIGDDILKLTSVDTDVLFFPSVDEVYPKGLDVALSLDFKELGNVMEGEFRPGHFDGMAMVVNRLLNIVGPNKLFMGQKDFQQAAIVGNMLKQIGSNVELVVCPIVREKDGLAMSSRNLRLEKINRENASSIFLNMTTLANDASENGFDELIGRITTTINSYPNFKLEYVSIVDGETLQDVQKYSDSGFIVACIAVWAGDIRLIDNVIIKNNTIKA